MWVPAKQFCRNGLGSQFEMAKEKTRFCRETARHGRQHKIKQTEHTTDAEECTGSDKQDSGKARRKHRN